jgi:NifU-like protein
MSYYPPKVSEKFHAPEHAGVALEANAVGTSATFVCGAVLRFTLRIDRETGEIAEAGFKTSGCGYAIAAAQILAESVSGKHLAELHGLEKNDLHREIADSLEVSDARREHCFGLAVEALQNAFADYRAARLEEWSGEKALICTCFGVSEETIERVIAEQWLETVEEVTDACQAGGGCGSCQPLIEDILETCRRENA